jgi:hypothetical protein
LTNMTKLGKMVLNEKERRRMQETTDKLRGQVKWGMSFTVAKCKIMRFGHKNPLHE